MPHETQMPFVDLVLSLTNQFKKRRVIDYLDGDYENPVLSLCYEQFSYGNNGVVSDILDKTRRKIRVLVKEGQIEEYRVIDNPNYDSRAEAQALPA